MSMQFFTKKVATFLTLTLIAFSLKSFSAEDEFYPEENDPTSVEDSIPTENVASSEEELPASENEIAGTEEEGSVLEGEVAGMEENSIPQEEVSPAEDEAFVPTEEMSASDTASISEEAEPVTASDPLASPEILTPAVEGPVVENKSLRSEGAFSIGGSVGFDYLTPHGRGNNPAIIGSDKNYNRYYGGTSTRLSLGYERPLVEKWFVGGQVFVGAHNTDTGWLDSDTEVNIKQTYSFGMRAEIGSYVSDDILLYAYLGVINSAFNIDYGDAALRSSLRTSLWGISPGLGMGINLDSHWRLNLEAFYTFYERRMKEIDLGGAGTFQVQMEPRELGIAVGISRKLS